ncbi:hypothetical protein SAMN05216499_11655 [Actinacidiphila paucisporea]|uniref:Uncharacterized protein n=1 Tax=Actinacidiphila paucisporea TaxID=310782 RepID=A0A1M7MIP2_9ACTN|nr:hypothetical protein SAMN05216499_11655 [Actinacidiphila paucisporea]
MVGQNRRWWSRALPAARLHVTGDASEQIDQSAARPGTCRRRGRAVAPDALADGDGHGGGAVSHRRRTASLCGLSPRVQRLGRKESSRAKSWSARVIVARQQRILRPLRRRHQRLLQPLQLQRHLLEDPARHLTARHGSVKERGPASHLGDRAPHTGRRAHPTSQRARRHRPATAVIKPSCDPTLVTGAWPDQARNDNSHLVQAVDADPGAAIAGLLLEVFPVLVGHVDPDVVGPTDDVRDEGEVRRPGCVAPGAGAPEVQ